MSTVITISNIITVSSLERVTSRLESKYIV